MKKIEFYSICNMKGKIEAVLQKGYTDGKYNYYSLHRDSWFAVDPIYGLAVAHENTRRKAVEKANSSENEQKVKDVITKGTNDERLLMYKKMIACAGCPVLG